MERLWENTAYFKSMLVKMGLTLTQSETPILPILIGDEGVAKQFSDQLLSHGVFAQSIVFPTVAREKLEFARLLLPSTLKKNWMRRLTSSKRRLRSFSYCKRKSILFLFDSLLIIILNECTMIGCQLCRTSITFILKGGSLV